MGHAKICKKCGEQKSVNLFSMDRQKKDGLGTYCKKCVSEYAKMTYSNPEFAARAKDRARIWANNHKQHVLHKASQWAKDHRERRREIVKKWDYNHKEQRAIKGREYRESNSDRCREYKKIWRKNNRHKHCSLQRKRTASKLNRTPKWGEQSAIDIHYIVAEMLNRATEIKWSVDHIIPLQGKCVSGLHVGNNLQIIPLIDNMRKGNSFSGDII